MEDKAAKIREELQQSIVDLLTQRLEAGEMTQERAKEIAKFVLQSLPENISYQDLMATIPKLDDHFTELTSAVLPIVLDYEAQMRKLIDGKISALIKENKLDQALEVTKKAVEFEQSLT